jgi:hypothetical protein
MILPKLTCGFCQRSFFDLPPRPFVTVKHWPTSGLQVDAKMPDMFRPVRVARKPAKLQWHYGPTATDKDPGKMWCYDCAKEVLWLYDEKPHGGYICLGCGRVSED